MYKKPPRQIKHLREKSLFHVVCYVRAQLNLRRILATIDLEKFKHYQSRYREADPPPHGYSKYLHIQYWMARSLTDFYFLKLDRETHLRILDIGTGAGYFPYVCQFFGHEAAAIDLDNTPMYNELCAFLNVDRRTWRVEKFQPLPPLGGRFDVVTAFMIKFNQHYLPDQWSADEWRFMIDDLKTNQLTTNGRIVLSFNANKDGTWYDHKMRAYFESIGGRIYGNKVHIGPGADGKWFPTSAKQLSEIT